MTLTFETTEEKPTGRSSVEVRPEVWTALEEAAKEDVGKWVTIAETEVAKLRKQLASAKVRRAYDVTTEIKRVDAAGKKLAKGIVRFGIGAKAKPPEDGTPAAAPSGTAPPATGK